MHRARTVAAGVLRGAFYSIAIGLTIHLAIFYAPPLGNTHPTDRADDIEQSLGRLVPNGIVVVAACAIVGTLAGFASTFPPRPLSFTWSLGVIFLCAGIARLATTSSIKILGSWDDHRSYLVTAIAACVGAVIAVAWGFKNANRAKTETKTETKAKDVQPEQGH